MATVPEALQVSQAVAKWLLGDLYLSACAKGFPLAFCPWRLSPRSGRPKAERGQNGKHPA